MFFYYSLLGELIMQPLGPKITTQEQRQLDLHLVASTLNQNTQASTEAMVAISNGATVEEEQQILLALRDKLLATLGKINQHIEQNKGRLFQQPALQAAAPLQPPKKEVAIKVLEIQRDYSTRQDAVALYNACGMSAFRPFPSNLSEAYRELASIYFSLLFFPDRKGIKLTITYSKMRSQENKEVTVKVTVSLGPKEIFSTSAIGKTEKEAKTAGDQLLNNFFDKEFAFKIVYPVSETFGEDRNVIEYRSIGIEKLNAHYKESGSGKGPYSCFFELNGIYSKECIGSTKDEARFKASLDYLEKFQKDEKLFRHLFVIIPEVSTCEEAREFIERYSTKESRLLPSMKHNNNSFSCLLSINGFDVVEVSSHSIGNTFDNAAKKFMSCLKQARDTLGFEDHLELLKQFPPKEKKPLVYAHIPALSIEPKADSNDSVGMRSVMAVKLVKNIREFRVLSSNEFQGAKLKDDDFLIEVNEAGKSVPVVYRCVTGATRKFFNDKYPLLSIGSSMDREIISLDKDDKTLDTHYGILKKHFIEDSYTTRDVLAKVMNYVKSMFHWTSVEEVVAQAAEEIGCQQVVHEDPLTYKKTTIPIIPLHRFVKYGKGICRHHSLTVAYLLYRLTLEEKPLISGRVKHVRDFVKGGAHAWCVFIPKRIDFKSAPEKWMIDSLSGLVANFSELIRLEILKERYDPTSDEKRKWKLPETYSPIDNMIRKTSNAAKENGQDVSVRLIDYDDEKYPRDT